MTETAKLAAAIHAKLDTVLAGADAATAGPWEKVDRVPRNPNFVQRISSKVMTVGIAHPEWFVADTAHHQDAAFIAQSRTVTPQMARALKGVMNIVAGMDVDEWDQDWQFESAVLQGIARELGIPPVEPQSSAVTWVGDDADHTADEEMAAWMCAAAHG
jgi:hypothetical protein